MTATMVPLDRASPIPLWFQLAQQLEQQILSGQLAVGTRLDNEMQIAETLGLSRPTVRRAIQHLVERGLLVRKRGIGTQVIGSQVRRDLELTSLYEDLRRGGQEPTTQVLSWQVEPADPAVAFDLSIPPGAPTVSVQRLRLAHGEPLALMHNVLPAVWADAVPAERLAETGLYELLRAAGATPRLASQRIGARKATLAESRLLVEPRGAILLTATRITYDEQGRAIERGTHVYRASRYSFDLTLTSR